MHSKDASSSSSLTSASSGVAKDSRLDWDDLRYVLAVARAGSLSGAARALSVTHSTMLRRIDAIEEKLHVRLFERMRNGYIATDAGEALRRVAEQCEPLVTEAERQIIGGDTRLTGTLQVTTAYVVAQHLLPRALAEFCAAHPDIEVEMRAARERLDLARREADVALRMSAHVPDYLVGRQLSNVRLRVYAWESAPFLQSLHPSQETYPIQMLTQDLPWICFERDAQDRIYDRWMHAYVPQSSVVARADQFPNALALVRAGMGVTLLPEFVAKDVAGLVPLSAAIKELQTPLWILTHPDLRHTARIRVFMQLVGDALIRILQ